MYHCSVINVLGFVSRNFSKISQLLLFVKHFFNFLLKLLFRFCGADDILTELMS